MMGKSLWILAVIFAGTGLAFGAGSGPDRKDVSRAALEAYANMDYTQAGKLAKKISNTPKGQLVRGLCYLYDRSHPNIPRAQKTLAKLFDDEKTPLPYRLEAGVALGRTVQLMKERRDLYGNAADGYDHDKILEKVRKLAPGSQADRDAFFYLMRERLENPKQSDAAFKELEIYFRNFKGDPKLLPPLHLLAEYEYIRLRRDYKSAVRHLAEGYEIGFANPSETRSGLFRLGFLYDKKIHNKPMAVKYFKEYLKCYPYSGLAVVAQRFLNDLGEGRTTK